MTPSKKKGQTKKPKKTRSKKKGASGGKSRDIGIDVAPPKKTCDDVNCPFHGTLPVRGLILEGKVESDRMKQGAVVSRMRMNYIPKYERYEKRTSRYSVHNPPCIDAKEGDIVKIVECRPLSKTKSFVIVEKKESV